MRTLLAHVSLSLLPSLHCPPPSWSPRRGSVEIFGSLGWWVNVQDNHCYSPWSCEWSGLCEPHAGWKQPLGECVCVCVCVREQVLVSCRGEYSDSETPKQRGWLSYFQFTVERSWFSKFLLSQHKRLELRSEGETDIVWKLPRAYRDPGHDPG